MCAHHNYKEQDDNMSGAAVAFWYMDKDTKRKLLSWPNIAIFFCIAFGSIIIGLLILDWMVTI